MNGFSHDCGLHCHSIANTFTAHYTHDAWTVSVSVRYNARIIFPSIQMCAICALECVNNRWEGNHYFEYTFLKHLYELLTLVPILSFAFFDIHTHARSCVRFTSIPFISDYVLPWIANSALGLVSCVMFAYGKLCSESKLEFQIQFDSNFA